MLQSREEKEDEPKGPDKHSREGKVKVQRRSSRPAPLSSSQAFWKEERSPFPVYCTLATLLLAGLSSLTLFLPSPPLLRFCSIPFSVPSPSQFSYFSSRHLIHFPIYLISRPRLRLLLLIQPFRPCRPDDFLLESNRPTESIVSFLAPLPPIDQLSDRFKTTFLTCREPLSPSVH